MQDALYKCDVHYYWHLLCEERAVRSIDAFVTTELRARRTAFFATQLLAVWKCHQVLVHTCVILEVSCALKRL